MVRLRRILLKLEARLVQWEAEMVLHKCRPWLHGKPPNSSVLERARDTASELAFVDCAFEAALCRTAGLQRRFGSARLWAPGLESRRPRPQNGGGQPRGAGKCPGSTPLLARHRRPLSKGSVSSFFAFSIAIAPRV